MYTDTFQNNPRLTDKLGECGRAASSRAARPTRAATRTGGSRNLFRDAVAAQLKGLPAPTAAIAWAKPRATHGQPVDQIKDAGSRTTPSARRRSSWAACCWRPSSTPLYTDGFD